MLTVFRSLLEPSTIRHPRAQIRDAFWRRLSTPDGAGNYPTAAESRVFKSRLAPIDLKDDSELPAILIYVREDSRDVTKDYGVEAQADWARSELRIVVEGLVRGDKTVDDACDDLAFDIEAALENWTIPGFESSPIRLGDTDIDVNAQFAKPVGAIGLIYHVTYMRPWRDADVADDPFLISGLTPTAVGDPQPFADPLQAIYQLEDTP